MTAITAFSLLIFSSSQSIAAVIGSDGQSGESPPLASESQQIPIVPIVIVGSLLFTIVVLGAVAIKIHNQKLKADIALKSGDKEVMKSFVNSPGGVTVGETERGHDN